MNVSLNENERLDKVNDNINLIQRKNGLTFGTDALLLAAFVSKHGRRACELGCGTGIISLLLLQRKKADTIFAYEVQDEFADLTKRNATINGFEDVLIVHNKDLRNAQSTDNNGELDFIFTNPPYMKFGAGLNNDHDEKNIARREVFGTISDFCNISKKLLKFGGRFYCVYRPDRLAELMYAMRNASIEPKKLTFVHSHSDAPPSLVLIEGRLGAGEELNVTRPLVMYTDRSHKEYTEDLKYIYENGNFPEERFK